MMPGCYHESVKREVHRDNNVEGSIDMTMGEKLSALRRAKGYTQDEVAEKLGVSAQAVSKWENDVSCPDIMQLPRLAELFGVTIDELFARENAMPVAMVSAEERKPLEKMLLKIIVNSAEGDKVRVNLPMGLVKMGLEIGMAMPQISGGDGMKGTLENIDFRKILEMVEFGLVGKLVEVESADGDFVEIVVE